MHSRDCQSSQHFFSMTTKFNQLTRKHSTFFHSFLFLIPLDPSENSIKNLHAETFQNQSKLYWVILSKNNIKRIDINLFQNNLGLNCLNRIEIELKKLKGISGEVFWNLEKLQTLLIAGNMIGDVPVLVGLKSLESVQRDALLAMSKLNFFDFSRNLLL